MEILSCFKKLGKKFPVFWSMPSFDESEMHRWWVECEEARVNIMISLREAALPRHSTWCVSRPSNIIYAVNKLCEQSGYELASENISDIHLRLVIPKFVGDLLRCSVASACDVQLKRATNRIFNTVEVLERSLKNGVFFGDPAYLYYAYSIAGRLLEQRGEEKISEDMCRRRDGLRDRVHEIIVD